MIVNVIYIALYYKMSSFVKIELITKELFTRNTNIATKLNLKLLTKLIRAKQRSLGLHRHRFEHGEVQEAL
jgi:hypothetical protein